MQVSTAPLPQYMKGWTSSFDATTNIVTFQANSADDYLPDGTYMPFGLQVTLKDQTEALAPGDMVMALFKTTQTCVDASGVETSKYWSSMTHGADDTAPMIHISAPAEAMSTSDDDDSEG